MEAYSNSYGNIKNRKKFLLGKENEKNWPKEETNTVSSSILSRKKENPCRKQQGSWFGKCLRQSRHLLKIQSSCVKIRVFLKLSVNSCFSALRFLPLTFLALVLPLTLASLPITLHCHPELNSTE